MIFNSFSFIVFFAVVTTLYFLLGQKFKMYMLLIASCVFYMFFIPKYILILFLTIVIDYFAGIYIHKSLKHKKSLLIISIISNIGILFFFKYFNFFIGNINDMAHFFGWNYSLSLLQFILPIGLSFHTFQAMSYTIEVYRGNQLPEKNFGIYALYVMYYPQLVAGPIERPQNMLPQFHVDHKFNFERFKTGLLRMAFGFFKKIVIADRLAEFVNPVFAHPENYQGVSLLVAAMFFSIQIFCDFSGYSDIALGCSEIMGIKLMKNFDRPYRALSISEFWSRWHISLSTWFRDYVYIPLGGNKVSQNKYYRNIFIVFLLSGFWHGANWTFIIWGALHAFYLLFAHGTISFRNTINTKLHLNKFSLFFKFYQRALVFLLVTIAWIFFRADSFGKAIYFIKTISVEVPQYVYSVFSNSNFLWLEPLLINTQAVSLPHYAVLLISLTILFVIHHFQQKHNLVQIIQNKVLPVRWMFYSGVVLYLLLFGMYKSNSEFIYFQF